MIGIKLLKAKAKELKVSPTSAEKRAMDLLKKNKIKFYSQVVFGFYIIDIVIPNRLLILEIDGGYHETRKEHDKKRDEFCRDMGMEVLRVKNENVNSVIKKVKAFKLKKGYSSRYKIIKEKARMKRYVAECYHNKETK